MRDIITLLESKSKEDQLEIIPLNYAVGDLQPVLSAENIRFHYGKLAQGYAERFNRDEGDDQFNYAGAFLHNMLFTQYRERRSNNRPNGPVLTLINSKFKTWEDFKEQFKIEAMGIQGSGWCYLARDGSIKTIPNHEVRDDILLLIDMWEHSFQMDYGSDKSRYLDNIWKIINWSVINLRWGAAYK